MHLGLWFEVEGEIMRDSRHDIALRGITRSFVRGCLLAAMLAPLGCKDDPDPPEEEFGPFGVRSIMLGGEGYHGVELDGYGLATVAHWCDGDTPYHELNPYVSEELPPWYQEHGSPVAYEAGSTPTAWVELTAPDDAAGSWRVSGHGTGDTEIGMLDLVFEGIAQAEGGLLIVETTATTALPAQIGWTETFQIEWSVLPDGSTADPADAGASSVPLYLLPQAPQEDIPLLHTPVQLACDAAAGLEQEQEIIDAVWASFADREVPRARDGLPLEYYGRLRSAPGEFRSQLLAGAGQCTTWSFLLYATLGALGIESEVMGVFSSAGLGRIYVKDWAFLDGEEFITTGGDGICDTTAAGDDEQAFAVGTGRPYTSGIQAAMPPMGTLGGDDDIWWDYPSIGDNGILETPISAHDGGFVPTMALGFGLPQSRAYYLTVDPEEVELLGDDTIRLQISTYYVLTGVNGILETPQGEGMHNDGSGVSELPVGDGYTAINIAAAYPYKDLLLPTDGTPYPAGDDQIQDGLWVDTGPDGIADTEALAPDVQEIPLGQGAPDVPCVGPGPDGILDSTPAGDDGWTDILEILAYAPEGYVYQDDVNMWPLVGAPGQDTTAPPPDFPNHYILRIQGKYYDPSYGNGPFENHESWEAASLAADGTIVRDDDNNLLGTAVKTTAPLSYSQETLPPH